MNVKGKNQKSRDQSEERKYEGGFSSNNENSVKSLNYEGILIYFHRLD